MTAYETTLDLNVKFSDFAEELRYYFKCRGIKKIIAIVFFNASYGSAENYTIHDDRQRIPMPNV